MHQLEYYHIIDGLPSDIAHDLFEGVVPEFTLLVVQALVGEGVITFQYINDKIETFDYSVVDMGNKPPLILLTGGTQRMKYSQSQMWCLARLLP